MNGIEWILERVYNLILPNHVSLEASYFEKGYLASLCPDERNLYQKVKEELNILAEERSGVCYPIVAQSREELYLDYGLREPYYYPFRESLSTIRKMKSQGLPKSLFRDFLQTAKFPLQTTRQAKYHVEVLRAWMTTFKGEVEEEISWNIAVKKGNFKIGDVRARFHNFFYDSPLPAKVKVWDYDHFKYRWNFDLPRKNK